VRETVDGFRDHVNPGFLAYRKAGANGTLAAAVEWSDAIASAGSESSTSGTATQRS
jgi:hypothetical protein